MTTHDILAYVFLMIVIGALFQVMCNIIYSIAFKACTIATIKEVILTDKDLRKEIRDILNSTE